MTAPPFPMVRASRALSLHTRNLPSSAITTQDERAPLTCRLARIPAVTVKDEYDPLADAALLTNAATEDDEPAESRGRNREETPEGEDRGRERRDSKSDRSKLCVCVYVRTHAHARECSCVRVYGCSGWARSSLPLNSKL
jgi:hypothetical protein